MQKNTKVFKFIDTLLNFQDVKDLELYEDQGVKVSTHTYDVLNITINKILEKYENFENGAKKLDYFAITVGVIMHDISKSSIRRRDEELSHSQMMMKNPEYIIEEVQEVLGLIEKDAGVKILDNIKNNIIHIVLSHHGKWGKIQPETEEAEIVYVADMESAKYHRINPIQANDILKLALEGKNIEEIESELGCSATVIKDRIRRSKKEIKVATFAELLKIYEQRGRVPIGDKFFVLRAEETKKLKKLVDEKGFYNLIMQNSLMEYMKDNEVFEK
ncbi:HD domain-containing protein [Fusobacterium gastrosuis]|uniref:HD domain-containing protein n=1 Tax=Fusobacterium gastrosuis TaxID=1755100 RepID=UPI002976EEF8|nr:HD domain-containing protein [Fusobacteriaceae bacterium]MDY5713105.1 HD domain-containing protein [Fusobacterium gastrosuis]